MKKKENRQIEKSKNKVDASEFNFRFTKKRFMKFTGI